MHIVLHVTLKDFTENWKAVNLVQETDDNGAWIGPTEEQLLDKLKLGLLENDNVRGLEIFQVESVFKSHKTFTEDMDPDVIMERTKAAFGI